MGICRSCFVQDRNTELLVDAAAEGGAVRMLVVALDYKYSPGHELTCTQDARVMVKTAEKAGASEIVVVDDLRFGEPGFPTKTVVLKSIRKVASRCQAGD